MNDIAAKLGLFNAAPRAIVGPLRRARGTFGGFAVPPNAALTALVNVPGDLGALTLTRGSGVLFDPPLIIVGTQGGGALGLEVVAVNSTIEFTAVDVNGVVQNYFFPFAQVTSTALVVPQFTADGNAGTAIQLNPFKSLITTEDFVGYAMLSFMNSLALPPNIYPPIQLQTLRLYVSFSNLNATTAITANVFSTIGFRKIDGLEED